MGLFNEISNFQDRDVLEKIYFKLMEINERVIIMGTNQAALDLALNNLQTSLTAGLNTISTSLLDLLAKSQQNPTVDFTPEISEINTMVTALAGVVATATTDDPGPQTPPAPPVTTPPTTTPTT